MSVISWRGKLRGFRVLLSASAMVICLDNSGAQDQTLTTTILGDQVRSQGYECDSPSSAQKSAEESSPGRPVYLLTCEAATYKVVLIPDQAAQITKVK
jgi:hypothetical protein